MFLVGANRLLARHWQKSADCVWNRRFTVSPVISALSVSAASARQQLFVGPPASHGAGSQRHSLTWRKLRHVPPTWSVAVQLEEEGDRLFRDGEYQKGDRVSTTGWVTSPNCPSRGRPAHPKYRVFAEAAVVTVNDAGQAEAEADRALRCLAGGIRERGRVRNASCRPAREIEQDQRSMHARSMAHLPNRRSSVPECAAICTWFAVELVQGTIAVRVSAAIDELRESLRAD